MSIHRYTKHLLGPQNTDLELQLVTPFIFVKNKKSQNYLEHQIKMLFPVINWMVVNLVAVKNMTEAVVLTHVAR